MSSSSSNKNWASEYLIDPLTAPTPAEETGIGTSFLRSTDASSSSEQKGANSSVKEHKTGSSSNTNPFRRGNPKLSPIHSGPRSKASTSLHSRDLSLGSNSDSGIQKFPAFEGPRSASQSRESSTTRSTLQSLNSTRPRRSSSLRERYPGDMSHRPLDIITKDQHAANRSPHLRKKHHQGADSIDKLDDTVLGSYHHESAYDAVSLARNNSRESAPLAALEASNQEALKATPRENILDSLRSHRPLDGTSIIPPGEPDSLGRVLYYREGANMMIDAGGNYKRWPGIDYHPDDIKGKGEPSYTIEKALKEHKAKMRARGSSVPPNGEYELVERPRKSHDEAGEAPASISGPTNGKRLSGEFKRRFGSLRKKDKALGSPVSVASAE